MPDSGDVYAEFAGERALLRALDGLRERGHPVLETFAPFDVPGVDERLPGPDRWLPWLPLPPRSWLPWLAFAAGATGAAVSWAVQWYANAWSYPLNAGGRPANAAPAFVYATFEGLVLCAALAVFFGLLLVLRLPRLWDPVFELDGFERASDDRYWLVVPARTALFDAGETEALLRELGAVRVVRGGEPE